MRSRATANEEGNVRNVHALPAQDARPRSGAMGTPRLRRKGHEEGEHTCEQIRGGRGGRPAMVRNAHSGGQDGKGLRACEGHRHGRLPAAEQATNRVQTTIQTSHCHPQHRPHRPYSPEKIIMKNMNARTRGCALICFRTVCVPATAAHAQRAELPLPAPGEDPSRPCQQLKTAVTQQQHLHVHAYGRLQPCPCVPARRMAASCLLGGTSCRTPGSSHWSRAWRSPGSNMVNGSSKTPISTLCGRQFRSALDCNDNGKLSAHHGCSWLSHSTQGEPQDFPQSRLDSKKQYMCHMWDCACFRI